MKFFLYITIVACMISCNKSSNSAPGGTNSNSIIDTNNYFDYDAKRHYKNSNIITCACGPNTGGWQNQMGEVCNFYVAYNGVKYDTSFMVTLTENGVAKSFMTKGMGRGEELSYVNCKFENNSLVWRFKGNFAANSLTDTNLYVISGKMTCGK